MKTIVIDGAMMLTRDAAHDYLSVRLGLPDYYGRNLDGLYDLLTERSEPTRLVIYRRWDLVAALGPYGDSLLEAITDAGRNNPTLEVCFDEDGE